MTLIGVSSFETKPSAVVGFDDPELRRWLERLSDDELALGLRSLVARARHMLMVLDLVTLDSLDTLIQGHARRPEIIAGMNKVLGPLRDAADELSRTFVTIGHIDVHDHAAVLEAPRTADDSESQPHPGALRLRSARALNASRRLIAREWRILKQRLHDDSVWQSPEIAIAFCRAHLDRIRTLVECIAPSLYAALAPENIRAESAETAGALAIRGHVVDFHRGVDDACEAITRSATDDWVPHLQCVAEALDRLLYGIAFSWLRDSDQRMLTDCRETLDETLVMWSPLRTEPTRKLLGSLQRVSRSLLRVNDRPSLIAHDLDELRSMQAMLRASTESELDLSLEAKLLRPLDSIYGRDREIDNIAATGLSVSGALDVDRLKTRVSSVVQALESRSV